MKNRNRLLGTMFLALTALTGVSGYAQSETGNNGDIQESTVRQIMDDIRDWIVSGESKNLKGAPQDYSERMLKVLIAKPIFQFCEARNANDPHCNPKAGKVNKPCENFWDAERPVINCIRPEVVASNDQQLYSYIHHEVAGLAGIEINSGDPVSDYFLSQQVAASLQTDVIVRLGKNAVNADGLDLTLSCFLPNLAWEMKFNLKLLPNANESIINGNFSDKIGEFSVEMKPALVTRAPKKSEKRMTGTKSINSYDLDRFFSLNETNIQTGFSSIDVVEDNPSRISKKKQLAMHLYDWNFNYGPNSLTMGYTYFDLNVDPVLETLGTDKYGNHIIKKEKSYGTVFCRPMSDFQNVREKVIQPLRKLLEASFKLHAN